MRRRCCCGPSDFCVSSCLPSIPKTSLTATWTSGPGTTGTGAVTPAASGSGTMHYYPGGTSVLGSSFFAGVPVWKFISPNPTGASQRGTQVALACVANTPRTSITLLGSVFTSGQWIWQPLADTHSPGLVAGCCPRVQSFAVSGTAGVCTYSNGPNLSLVSSSAAGSPFQLDYDGVNGNGNAHARNFYTDLTIDGPAAAAFNDTGFQCCYPCAIPKANLTLTIGASTYTLAYNIVTQEWSDGTYTLNCSSAFLHLNGPGTWTLDLAGSSCGPCHFRFTGTSTAFVDE